MKKGVGSSRPAAPVDQGTDQQHDGDEKRRGDGPAPDTEIRSRRDMS
jgi:hypothetical protein